MSDLEAETQELDMQNALAIGRAIAKHFGVTNITSLSVDDKVIALDFKIKGVGYGGEEVNAEFSVTVEWNDL